MRTSSIKLNNEIGMSIITKFMKRLECVNLTE